VGCHCRPVRRAAGRSSPGANTCSEQFLDGDLGDFQRVIDLNNGSVRHTVYGGVKAFGVTVNALCPAAKSQAFFRAIGDYPELEAMADAANPMGRTGDPYDDIAPVAVFLASDASRGHPTWTRPRSPLLSPRRRCG